LYRHWLTGGGEVSASRTGHVPLHRNILICIWHSFLLEAEQTPGPNAAGRITLIIQLPYRAPIRDDAAQYGKNPPPGPAHNPLIHEQRQTTMGSRRLASNYLLHFVGGLRKTRRTERKASTIVPRFESETVRIDAEVAIALAAALETRFRML
jgi:hypothetical protein